MEYDLALTPLSASDHCHGSIHGCAAGEIRVCSREKLFPQLPRILEIYGVAFRFGTSRRPAAHIRPQQGTPRHIHIYVINRGDQFPFSSLCIAFDLVALVHRYIPHHCQVTMTEAKIDSPVDHDQIASKDVSDGAVEMQGSAEETKGDLKLDQYGYALVPQPSHFRDDPLVCCSIFLGSILVCIVRLSDIA